MEKLTCTKMVRVEDGRHHSYHKLCGAPAAVYEFGGLLTKAKAVLCHHHKLAADREAFVSARGFPQGKIAAKEKKERYQQTRFPGTGAKQIAPD